MRTIQTSLFIFITCVLLGSQGCAANSTVEQTLESYAKFANEQDVSGMKSILHPDFRSISNQLFGSTSVGFTTRDQYLGSLEKKEIGGGSRQMTILSIKTEGKTASAQLLMKGSDISFKLFVFLIQLPDGTWQIISDMPHILA